MMVEALPEIEFSTSATSKQMVVLPVSLKKLWASTKNLFKLTTVVRTQLEINHGVILLRSLTGL